MLATKPQAELLEILQRDVNKLSEKDQGYLKREANKLMAACEAIMDEHASSNAVMLVSRGPTSHVMIGFVQLNLFFQMRQSHDASIPGVPNKTGD